MMASLRGSYGTWQQKQKDAYEGETGKKAVKFEKGTLGFAQFAYTSKRTKADREAAVSVLTGLAVAA